MAALSAIKVPSILKQTIEQAFPVADPQYKPYGSRVLLQIKSAASETQQGLILSQSDIETEHDNTRIAKVLKVGPGAFKNRDTGELWPEGAWCQAGTYVRIGLYGGDRWRVSVGKDKNGVEQFAHFASIEDLNIMGEIEGDPMKMLAWIG